VADASGLSLSVRSIGSFAVYLTARRMPWNGFLALKSKEFHMVLSLTQALIASWRISGTTTSSMPLASRQINFSRHTNHTDKQRRIRYGTE